MTESMNYAKLDYYVHFEGLDKRNDCWLTQDKIKQTAEEVVLKNEKKMYLELANLHPNDNPHYGLTLEDFYTHE